MNCITVVRKAILGEVTLIQLLATCCFWHIIIATVCCFYWNFTYIAGKFFINIIIDEYVSCLIAFSFSCQEVFKLLSLSIVPIFGTMYSRVDKVKFAEEFYWSILEYFLPFLLSWKPLSLVLFESNKFLLVPWGKLVSHDLVWSKENSLLFLEIYKLLLATHCVKSVHILSLFWSVFSRIRTEYGHLRNKSPYSVRKRENTDEKKLRIWTFFTQWHWHSAC